MKLKGWKFCLMVSAAEVSSSLVALQAFQSTREGVFSTSGEASTSLWVGGGGGGLR